MKKFLVKGLTTLTVASLMFFATAEYNKASAVMSTFSAAPAMSTFSDSTMTTATTTANSDSNYAMDSLMQQMQDAFSNNQAETNQKESTTAKNPNKVSAYGYVTEVDGKYYIGDGDGRHQVVTERGDIIAVLPILVDTDMLVEFQGTYDEKNKIVKAEYLKLTKTPSSYLKSLIDEALEDYKATQPTSGRGYIVEKDGEYVLKIKKEYYSIETELEDIITILPMIAAEGDYTLVEVIGVLDAEEKIFKKVTQLNFLENLDKDFLKRLNQGLLLVKDGKEVDASGFIRKSDGKYYIDVLEEKYEIVLSDLYKDVQGIVPIVANKEVAVTMKGILDLSSKTLEGTKIDIASEPSASLLEKINAVLEEHAEGDANVVGTINEISGDLYLSVKEKHYKINVDKAKPEVLKFVNVLKGTDEKVKATGLISNKNLTIEIGAITLVGIGSESVRKEIATQLSEYIKLPESGSEVQAKGVIVEKNGKYYQIIAFNDYLIKTTRKDLTQALPILAKEGVIVTTNSVIDNELKLVDVNKITINEAPSDEALKELNAIAVENGGTSDKNITGETNSNAGKTNNDTQNSTSNIWDTLRNNGSSNSSFGSGFGDLFSSLTGGNSLFNSLLGGSTTPNSNGETTSPANGLNNLWSQLGNGGSGFGNFGTLFAQMGGNSSLFSSLLGNSNNSPMTNLSVDQIKGQLDGISSASSSNTTEGSSDNSITSNFSSGKED